MNKITISGLSNYGDETYISFKVDADIIRKLHSFFWSLIENNWDFHFEESVFEPKVTEKRFHDPKYWKDRHIYSANKDFHIHTMFGDKRVHILVKHNKKSKQKLIKAIEEHCEWVKLKSTDVKGNKKSHNSKARH